MAPHLSTCACVPARTGSQTLSIYSQLTSYQLPTNPCSGSRAAPGHLACQHAHACQQHGQEAQGRCSLPPHSRHTRLTWDRTAQGDNRSYCTSSDCTAHQQTVLRKCVPMLAYQVSMPAGKSWYVHTSCASSSYLSFSSSFHFYPCISACLLSRHNLTP